MSETDTKLERIRGALASLKKKTGPRRTEAEVAAVESTLGFPLPESYRTYLLAIGDSGFGLADEVSIPSIAKLSAKTVAAARKRFPLTGPWCSPDPRNVASFEKVGLYAERKDRFYPLPAGADPTDGTLPLGVPTGTHEYYVLVLQGAFAGQVWVDASREDTGGVEPAPQPDFLDAVLAYLEAKVDERRSAASVKAMVVAGRVGELVEKASSKRLSALFDEVEAAIYEILRPAEPPVDACRGVAASAFAAAEAATNDPFKRATFRRIASLAALMALDFERARELTERCLEPNGVPQALHDRFVPSLNLHLLFADAGLARPIGKVRPPKRVSDYRIGHFEHTQLVVAFRRMPDAARATVLDALPAVWGNALEER